MHYLCHTFPSSLHDRIHFMTLYDVMTSYNDIPWRHSMASHDVMTSFHGITWCHTIGHYGFTWSYHLMQISYTCCRETILKGYMTLLWFWYHWVADPLMNNQRKFEAISQHRRVVAPSNFQGLLLRLLAIQRYRILKRCHIPFNRIFALNHY